MDNTEIRKENLVETVLRKQSEGGHARIRVGTEYGGQLLIILEPMPANRPSPYHIAYRVPGGRADHMISQGHTSEGLRAALAHAIAEKGPITTCNHEER